MDQRRAAEQRLGRTESELKTILEQEKPICPICAFVTAAVIRYIDNLFYENVNDGPTRDAIRRGQGFCRYHAQMVSNQADALGSAILLKDVITTVLRDIERGEFIPKAHSNALMRFLNGANEPVEQPQCAICAVECDLETLAVDAFVSAIANEDVRDRFTRSHGLCIPHFRLAAARHREDPGWSVILGAETGALRDLASRLDELSRSYDYRSTEKPPPSVTRSWREGLNITSRWVELCEG